MNLATQILEAETALHALMTGQREQEITTADGRRVVYTPTTMKDLQSYLADLRAQQTTNQRRPIYFQF